VAVETAFVGPGASPIAANKAANTPPGAAAPCGVPAWVVAVAVGLTMATGITNALSNTCRRNNPVTSMQGGDQIRRGEKTEAQRAFPGAVWNQTKQLHGKSGPS
jgi:hypothetical protein